MVLFGSRSIAVVLYALAVMGVVLLGFTLFSVMFGKPLSRAAWISWCVITLLTAVWEALYSELEIWQQNNGMAGVWLYLMMPFLAAVGWVLFAVIPRRRRR
ncbi:MAG: hypothetical protein IJX93_04310 [Clostridia bacterium]|nr:hypothetical protein [Clostridia bacterium]